MCTNVCIIFAHTGSGVCFNKSMEKLSGLYPQQRQILWKLTEIYSLMHCPKGDRFPKIYVTWNAAKKMKSALSLLLPSFWFCDGSNTFLPIHFFLNIYSFLCIIYLSAFYHILFHFHPLLMSDFILFSFILILIFLMCFPFFHLLC